MIITALVMGLVGSLHCLTMCGPLLMLVHRGRSGKDQILYHGARIFIYVVMGALVGTLGKVIEWGSSQQALSLTVGALMIIGVWFATGNRRTWPPVSWLQRKIGRLQSKNVAKSMVMWGALNGLLPCGLTYVAVAASMAQADAWQSALYMMVFGMGTLPILTVLLKSKDYLSPYLNLGTKALRYTTIAVGMLLMVRGMGLGVPYLSPSFDQSQEAITICK